MKYNYTVKKDGKFYKAGDEVPDLGSLVATSVEGKIRNYEGLSKDFNKLPTYDDLATGSSAFLSDTGDVYKYEATTKTWNKI